MTEEAKLLRNGVLHSCVGNTLYGQFARDDVLYGENLRVTMEKYGSYFVGCDCNGSGSTTRSIDHIDMRDEVMDISSEDVDDDAFPTSLADMTAQVKVLALCRKVTADMQTSVRLTRTDAGRTIRFDVYDIGIS